MMSPNQTEPNVSKDTTGRFVTCCIITLGLVWFDEIKIFGWVRSKWRLPDMYVDE